MKIWIVVYFQNNKTCFAVVKAEDCLSAAKYIQNLKFEVAECFEPDTCCLNF